MSFRNPVYPHSFPDPFVLKYKGEYWAYCTGFQPDGRTFGILHSPDLVHWQSIGGALEPLPGNHTCYWAPEVTYEDDGRFLLYYSVGNEERMEIRVAIAEHPAGPFVDNGKALTTEIFAIDPHVFKDTDGSRYLFYATDFLTHSHIGTGTVCDRMLSPFNLAGNPQPVTRAKYDWQVYDPKRENKGGVRWHTVEGPFVLKHKNLYYEMYSGGNWQNLSYGVSYATSSEVMPTSEEWTQHADGERNLPILRTIPNKVIGPGHNSVVLGPDNRQNYIVYHLWYNGERVLAIDKLDFVGERMIVLGPTTEEEPGPVRASVGPLGGADLTGIESILAADSRSEVELGSTSALVEFWARLENAATLRILVDDVPESEANVVITSGHSVKSAVWIRYRIEIDGLHFKISIGDKVLQREGLLRSIVNQIGFEANDGRVEFSPIEITRGFEDLFAEYFNPQEFFDRGWNLNGEPEWILSHSSELLYRSSKPARITKSLENITNYELIVNLRLLKEGDPSNSSCSIYLGEPSVSPVVSIRANAQGEGFLTVETEGRTLETFTPSMSFDPFEYHQIRIAKVGGRVSVQFENDPEMRLEDSDQTHAIGLGATGAAAFDMIRLTEIVEE